MIKRIKSMLGDDPEVLKNMDHIDKNDKALNDYIIYRAKKKLDGNNGYVSDDMVIGWAKHFYLESKETIDKEMERSPIKKAKSSIVVPKLSKSKSDNNQLSIFDL
jgi:hypothetical protein